jgi:hypothetical protein
MVNIDDAEATNLATHLGQTRETFDEKYISKGESGRMVINSIPCHFLVENSCSVTSIVLQDVENFQLFIFQISIKGFHHLYALRQMPHYF